MQNPFKAVILAGGKGKRLMPLTSKLPKPLLCVNKETPLERCISLLKDANINNVAVTTGYLGEEIEKLTFEPINVTYFREETPKGTAGAVMELINSLDDDFFVLSGDVIFDVDLQAVLSFHKEKQAAVTIVSVKSNFPTEYGTIIEKDGEIKAFLEKPSWKQVISTKINTGIYVINKNVLKSYKENFKDFAQDLFPRLLENKEKICCFESTGYWCDMGTPESYLSCNMYFSKGKNVLGDFIFISKDAKIESCVVMNGVKIEKGSFIRNSIIGEGVSIGKRCVIENAVIGPDCLICDDAVIKNGGVLPADTIVGKGKVIEGSSFKNELFSDSGEIFIPAENSFILQKTGNALSFFKDVLLFHDGTEKAQKIASDLCYFVLESGGSCFAPELATSFLASFASAHQGTACVFVSEKDNGFSCLIFDKYGLPLSREDQINMEKHTPPKNTQKSKAYPPIDVLSLYIDEKSKIFGGFISKEQGKEMLFYIKDEKNKTLSEILKRLEIPLKAVEEETKNTFCISEDGTDVYFVDETEKIDKVHLLQICLNYIPCEGGAFPSYLPQEVFSQNHLHFSYDDSAKGRQKISELYNFNDGISIALGVICACIVNKASINQLLSTLKPFCLLERVFSIKGNKGEIFENLIADICADSQAGIHKESEKGGISIFPQYKNEFKVFANASSFEAAEELVLWAGEEFEKVSH